MSERKNRLGRFSRLFDRDVWKKTHYEKALEVEAEYLEAGIKAVADELVMTVPVPTPSHIRITSRGTFYSTFRRLDKGQLDGCTSVSEDNDSLTVHFSLPKKFVGKGDYVVVSIPGTPLSDEPDIANWEASEVHYAVGKLGKYGVYTTHCSKSRGGQKIRVPGEILSHPFQDENRVTVAAYTFDDEKELEFTMREWRENGAIHVVRLHGNGRGSGIGG